MKPQTPLMQAKHWGILLYFAAVYTFVARRVLKRIASNYLFQWIFVSLVLALFGAQLIASKAKA